MPPTPSDHELLIALNAAPTLPRATVCALALGLGRWRGCRPAERPAAARQLGLPPEHLEAALDWLREAPAVAARELQRTAELEAEIVTLLDPSYPPALRDLSLPPPVLYCRGTVPDAPAIAVVGSRRADPYGRQVAELFAQELAQRGVVIVSGFARGIDAAAHRGALAAGGATVAVLGCGLDVDYPRGRSPLARRAAETGAVITEFPFGAAPRALNFPIRNRIIAALASGTLVVQAAARSGSLITARLALELGREVYAVPGRIFDERAMGPNALIRDGALLAQHPRDIVESLPLALRARLRIEPETADSSEAPALPGAAGKILSALCPGEPRTPEEVAAAAGVPLHHTLAALMELELSGRVARFPGPAYARKPAGRQPPQPDPARLAGPRGGC